jgi:hypothetical protein
VTFFGDHSDGEYGLYVLWDSKDKADAAAAVIGPRLEQHLSGKVQRPPDRRLFEVLQASNRSCSPRGVHGARCAGLTSGYAGREQSTEAAPKENRALANL